MSLVKIYSVISLALFLGSIILTPNLIVQAASGTVQVSNTTKSIVVDPNNFGSTDMFTIICGPNNKMIGIVYSGQNRTFSNLPEGTYRAVLVGEFNSGVGSVGPESYEIVNLPNPPIYTACNDIIESYKSQNFEVKSGQNTKVLLSGEIYPVNNFYETKESLVAYYTINQVTPGVTGIRYFPTSFFNVIVTKKDTLFVDIAFENEQKLCINNLLVTSPANSSFIALDPGDYNVDQPNFSSGNYICSVNVNPKYKVTVEPNNTYTLSAFGYQSQNLIQGYSLTINSTDATTPTPTPTPTPSPTPTPEVSNQPEELTSIPLIRSGGSEYFVVPVYLLLLSCLTYLSNSKKKSVSKSN